MAKSIAVHFQHSATFQTAWRRALQEYHQELLPDEERNVNLNDPAWLEVQSVDDLAKTIGVRKTSFDKDTARGTIHSGAIQNSLSGVQTLINMFGSAAGAAFPPCSQVLGAVSVLMTAGQKVSGAFDEVSDLFVKIGGFLTQLKVLSQVEMEPELETCVTNILVCTLRICGMATRKAYHDESIEEVKDGHTIRRIWKKAKQKTMSNGSQYLKQLLLGDDPDIASAVSQLRGNVDAEQRMISALTKKDTTEIKAVSVYIGELSSEINDTTIGTQRDVRDIQARVVQVQDSVQQVGTGVVRIESEVVRVGYGVSRLESEQAQMAAKLDELSRAGFANSQTAARPNDSAASKSKAQTERLRSILHPSPSNQSLFLKFKQERAKGTSGWVLKEPLVSGWLDRDRQQPQVLIISGKPGSGKTFLATRIIEELQERFRKGASERPTSIAFSFCRKQPAELSSMDGIIRTLAFQILDTDAAYSKHISAESRMETIRTPETFAQLWDILIVSFFQGNPNSSTVLVIDGIDECGEDDGEDFQDFLNCLKDCVSQSAWFLRNVQLLILTASKDAKKLTDIFGSCASHFPIDETRTIEDLDTLVKHRLDKEWKRSLIPLRLRTAVHTTVQEHCKGDFLRTSLILEEITSLSREDDIWALLSRPPKSVAEATSLVLRRLCRTLDKHGLEDLVDILAWVAHSHTPLSLETLDAILTVRNYEGSRLVDLRKLIEDKYTALFIASQGISSGPLRPEEDARRRLGSSDLMSGDLDNYSEHDLGEVDASAYQDDLSRQYHTRYKDNDADQKLAELANIEVRLADNIADHLSVVTDAFTTDNLACRTLLDSLKIMCDPPETVDEAASKKAHAYCARNLAMYLQDVKVGEVEARKTREVVRLLLKVFRDERIIERWISVEDIDLCGDLLLTPEVEEKLLAWFRSPDIQGRLPSSDLEWISAAIESPFKSLYEGLARGYAHQWLTQDLGWGKDDTAFTFVTTYQENLQKSKNEVEVEDAADIDAADDPQVTRDENSPAERTRGTSISSSSIEQICDVAEWAVLTKNAQWYRSLARALLQAWKMEAADEQLQKALSADPEDPKSYQDRGFVLWLRSHNADSDLQKTSLRTDAVACVAKAVELYKSRIAEPENRHLASREKLASSLIEAKCYLASLYEYAKNNDAADEIYKHLVTEWEDQDFEKTSNEDLASATCSYLALLIKSARDDEATKLLDTIVSHAHSRGTNYYTIYEWNIYRRVPLLEFACRSKRFDLFDQFWQNGTFVVACRGLDGELAELRYSHAFGIARLRLEWRRRAIKMLKLIIIDPAASHEVTIRAEKELAQIYLALALGARNDDRWAEVDRHFQALHTLVRRSGSQDSQNFKDSESALFLASWYHLDRRMAKARAAVKPLLIHLLALLYDDEPDNDEDAWYNISNVALVVGDMERALAATNLKRSIATYRTKTTLFKLSETREDSLVEQNGDHDPSTDQNETQETRAEEPLNSSDQVLDGSSGGANESSLNALESQTADGLQKATEITDDGTSRQPTNGVTDTANAKDQAIATATLERDQSATEEESKVEAAEDRWGGFGCDGPCFGTPYISPTRSFYRCTVCTADLCEACYKNIKAGLDTNFYICGSTHDWLLVPALERCSDGMIRVGGKEVPICDWLDELSEEWSIPKGDRLAGVIAPADTTDDTPAAAASTAANTADASTGETVVVGDEHAEANGTENGKI